MASRLPHQAAMTRAFAAKEGLSERGASWNRKNQTPKWQAFAASWNPPPSVERPVSPPGEMPTARERADMSEREAWKTLQECVSHKRVAFEKGDADAVAGWIKVEGAAAKALREASEHRVQVELESGRLIPASEIDRIRSEFLQPLGELLKTAPSIVGPEANPAQPQVGIDAVRNYLRNRLYPALEALASQLPA